MVKIRVAEKLAIPSGVKVEVKNRIVTVTGPRGTLTKSLNHLMLDIRVRRNGTELLIGRWFGQKPLIACINTAKSTVRNMINGVLKGYRYKMRFAYAHFPINVTADNNVVEIRNFLGEKRVRRLAIPADVKVYRTDQAKTKDELVLEGNDLQSVSQACARLHEQCLVKNKDIRMFLDGLYVQTKEFIQA